MVAEKFLSVFSPATEQQRKANFDDYWTFTQQHGGELFELEKDLAKSGPDCNISRKIQLVCANRSPIRKGFTGITSKCRTTRKAWTA